MGERERYRPPSMRVITPPTDSSQSTPVVAPDLRSRGVMKVFRNLPVWGQVMVLCSVGLGASAGAVVGGVAKVLGVQTTAAAEAARVELKGDIEAVKKGQQSSDAVDAQNHADVISRIEALQKALAATNVNIRVLSRQLAARRTVKPKDPDGDQ